LARGEARQPIAYKERLMLGWWRFVGLGLAICIAGCSSAPIAQDIAQSQANEIVALLADNGISAVARKGSGGQSRYTVEVDAGYYTEAVSLLHRAGLPGEVKRSFADLIAPQGLIPNSRDMEALRLDHALAAEVEAALTNHPAVMSARVIVRSNFSKDKAEAAVSAVIQHRPEMTVNPESMSGVILRAVPGVRPENVYIAIEPASANGARRSESEGVTNVGGSVVRVPLVPFLLGRVPKDEYNFFTLGLVGSLILLGCVGAVIGYWWGYYHRSKPLFDEREGDPRQLRLDRLRRDLPET